MIDLHSTYHLPRKPPKNGGLWLDENNMLRIYHPDRTAKPYPSARRELRQAEVEAWHRDTYAQGWTPPKPRLTPLRAFLLLVWALIVANGIGAVIGFWWRP